MHLGSNVRAVWRCLGWLVAAAVVSAVMALANWNDTPTGIDLAKLPHFRLTKLHSRLLKDNERARFDNVEAQDLGPGSVRLQGHSRSGRSWTVYLAHVQEVWRGDLDGNGVEDYVLASIGPYFNGRITPSFSLSILLMDADAMPVPFFTSLYHGENGGGIRHLVDFNRDGRAELLIQTYDENASDPRVGAFCSGHWTTQLYEFRNLAVVERQTRLGGFVFPLVHNWSYRGTLCKEEIPPWIGVLPARRFERGTAMDAAAVTRLRGVTEHGLLTVDPVAGCSQVRPAVVAYERPEGRTIAFPEYRGPEGEALLARMREDGARVWLRGIDRGMGEGACAVNLLWGQ